MKICITIVLFTCMAFSFIACAQSNAMHCIKKGDDCVLQSDFNHAIKFYKKAITLDSTNIAAKEKLAQALIENTDIPGAEAIYRALAIGSHANPIDKYNYAQVLCMRGKYNEAAVQYSLFAAETPEDPRAAEFKNFAQDIKPLLKDDNIYELTDLPENSSSSDVGTSFCLYDLCISSNRGHKSSYDLYVVHGADSATMPDAKKLAGNINGRFDEGPATFTADGKEMIFTRSNYKKKSSDGSRKHGLYHAVYDPVKKKWKNIRPLSFINYNYNFMHPCLSKDGNKLFFASDRPGGYGETDLYVSMKEGKEWGAPVNLGKGINTAGKEMFPYLANDSTLYFATDCRVGLGGLDIYYATFTNGAWGQVHNMGAPFNSSFDDFGLVLDPTGTSGYLVSNRPGGKGSDDIYRFARKSPLHILSAPAK